MGLRLLLAGLIATNLTEAARLAYKKVIVDPYPLQKQTLIIIPPSFQIPSILYIYTPPPHIINHPHFQISPYQRPSSFFYTPIPIIPPPAPLYCGKLCY